jgi:hypothetical protein
MGNMVDIPSHHCAGIPVVHRSVEEKSLLVREFEIKATSQASSNKTEHYYYLPKLNSTSESAWWDQLSRDEPRLIKEYVV